ncbi:hypothetical protein NLM59_03675 [Weeksellaceae bacterium KMM 9724]|uniref:hypothetical protein n=1 Tax=Profundicola chukchiensis TaxID=2961959 RepID=UPI00243768B6|nr:hypothetical protein [Profundicola chukchiensis]MDG4950014.1 hypothetical protein [Profundicola chukchiensis]
MLKSYRIVIFENLLGSERGLNVRIKFDLNYNLPDIIGVTTNWFGGELFNEWFYDDNNWSSTINNNHIHLIGSLEQRVLINGYGIKIIEHEIHVDFNVDSLGNMVGSPNVELIIQ